MDIIPFANLQSGNAQYLGLLYDTDVPAGGEKGIHTAFNEAIGMRLLNMTRIGQPVASQMVPSTTTTLVGNNFIPSWIETVPKSAPASMPAGAKRIVPKVRFAPIDQRFATQARYYNESVAVGMIGHHMDAVAAFSSSGNRVLSTSYNVTTEGWWLIAEYDFGAEIELKSLLGTNCGSTNNVYMLFNTTQTVLQALVGDVWTDALDLYANMRLTSNYGSSNAALPTSVKAQKFRIVNKNATFPWLTVGHYPFGLHFFGNYTGTKPRTLGKYKHMTLLHVMPNSAYSTSVEWVFNYPTDVATVLGRYCSMIHVAITDDLSQAGYADIYMRDATYAPQYTEVPLPAFKIKAASLKGRGV